MFVPISRLFTILMAGVVCFGLIVPLALMRHNVTLAAIVGGLFLLYLVGNLMIWKRMRT
ncbi:MAG TPA: hypothetical protein VFE36_10855 [Candidatus Baltobacteraceae bacterium]|jgi:hypothetical protein|nr:hypothetical protein [Candidatus Baltobacteraceae bacterium]